MNSITVCWQIHFWKKYHEMFLEQFPREEQGAKPDRLLPLTQQGDSSFSFKTGLFGYTWDQQNYWQKFICLINPDPGLITIRIHENQLPVPTCQSSLLLGREISSQNFCSKCFTVLLLWAFLCTNFLCVLGHTKAQLTLNPLLGQLINSFQDKAADVCYAEK